MGSFLAQFSALCRKNWIILWRHKWINLLRCILLPIAYAAFFAKAQDFFTTRSILGQGHIAPLLSLPTNLGSRRIVWSPPRAAATNATLDTFFDDLMSKAMTGVSGYIEKVQNSSSIDRACPQNYNGLSNCFAAVSFGAMDEAAHELTYTLRSDFGLTSVDVDDHTKDDVQLRLPFQWAIESTFIEMTTGTVPPSPMQWEYTNQSIEEFDEVNRLSYLRGIRSLIVLAFFLLFLGVVYQLPGSMASERASSLTAHLTAMGCRRSARIISWHLSVSAAYFPAWICSAAIFQHFIFKNTNSGLFIALHIVTGLSLASWTVLIQAVFASAPTLAAITSTFLAIILAVGALLSGTGTGMQLGLTLVFPPMFYVYFTKALTAWELLAQGPNLLHRSPRGDPAIIGLLLIAILDIFLFPLLASYLEDFIYEVRGPESDSRLKRALRRSRVGENLPDGVAVQLDHLRKKYFTRRGGFLWRGKSVTAIEDLSFTVPKGEIFCLLGRNGAAKSTTLSAIARLIKTTSGEIRYAEDLHVGLASQKDVLWAELTCKQHVALWRAIKTTSKHRQAETDVDLLARCDLAPKVRFLSKNLSGGQKRKLQLACALAGGSNLLLLDEITSGLDPLSRRAIWKLITANRGSTTIILTTHFLDEADYLGDKVAILQQPGRLLALDSPVGLKTQLGRGYTITITSQTPQGRVLAESMDKEVPDSVSRDFRGRHLISTSSSDLAPVRKVLGILREARMQGMDVDFQVNSSTLEEVFLDLNSTPCEPDPEVTSSTVQSTPSNSYPRLEKPEDPKDLELASIETPVKRTDSLLLSQGRKPSYLSAIPRDAWTVFRKRLIVLRRSWLLPLIAIVVVVCAASIPLFFMNERDQTCALDLRFSTLQKLTYPLSGYPAIYTPVVVAPATAFGAITLPTEYVRTAADNASFIDLFANGAYNVNNITFGGISLATDPTTQPSLFAWEGASLLNKGPSALNLMSNALLDSISPPQSDGSIDSAFRIQAQFRYLDTPSFWQTADAMKWIAFYGLGVAVWPAFAAIYPILEKASNVRSNQYSNGATPVSLWLGHLLHDTPSIILVSSLITILLATLSHQFSAFGFVWICLVLYGISATLFAYCAALWLESALAGWAVVAGLNVILFLLYLASYLLILTYDRSSNAPTHMSVCHFTISLISPVPNMVRATLVSMNLFSLLCDGLGNYAGRSLSSLYLFGGPILYMVVQAFLAFGLLVYVDSGSPLPSFLRHRKNKAAFRVEATTMTDVVEEKERLDRGSSDALQVSRLKKRYGGADWNAVDDVSFGVKEGETFALIGPNGAGKTTTLACIRGVELPTGGDVIVNGYSVIKRRNAARGYLGVCPQVNAIDSALTVRQHLQIYARLKGVPRRAIPTDIHTLLSASGLLPKADQLATSLSGGNQRKLSLAMALIGDRPVVLIDEFSSGVDPFSKREAWGTLERLTKDRAVVMTTHSMEEVDALASRVGIIASRLLAVGTPGDLKGRFATYELHMDSGRVDIVLAALHRDGFTGAQRSLDTSTRVSVPGVRENELGRLLQVMDGLDGGVGMTIHEASTETAFLEIVRSHNVQEEEGRVAAKRSWWRRFL
ncbi:hypothetical protein BCR39DRAFT_541062 [Naematelia encephala]|uniref:ABC transporter domain-containing protein n=1 Tax=Naematelia encephala TaxID=71784 RepID=A0A1Y2AVB5_9TREE|nr:hypothetical protein BCR39DRAFT_541062 [Naematelia encephala]